MTCKCIQNYNFSCDFRLTFGVPLEDVFPYGNVHPSIIRLFDITYQYYLQGNEAISCLVTKDPPELIAIIDALTYNRPFPKMLSFALLVSTLKHYFNTLPVPLLPNYTDKKHFSWLALSAECRDIIKRRSVNSRDNGGFIEILSEELLRLPRVNLLLISYFVNFLRSLVYFGKSRQRYNKRSANILINYFCASIFTRSSYDKSRETYHPLMLYLIVKWPHIQRKCIEMQPFCFQTDASQMCRSLSLRVQTKVDAEIIPLSRLSIISEGSDEGNTRQQCNQSTCMHVCESVYTQTSVEHRLLDEVLQEMSKCYKETKASQTVAPESKKTSTVSLLAYTRNIDIRKPESVPSELNINVKRTSINGSISGDKPGSEGSLCFKLNGDILEKLEENLETMRTLPSSTELTDTDQHNFKTDQPTKPLTCPEKQRKSLLKLAKMLPAIALIKQIKDLKLIGRARSEDFMKENIKYQKLSNKQSATF